MMMKIFKYGSYEDYQVPGWLYEWLNKQYDFKLNVSAIYHWDADSVFCNVPHVRNIGDWVRKAYITSQEGKIVVLLLPVRTDTAWFHEYVSMAHKIYFLRGRVNVNDERGVTIGKWGFPHMIVIFDGNKEENQEIRYLDTKNIREKYDEA